MATVLVLTCSPRGERSVSRALTTRFAQEWARHHPQDTIRLRDLGHHPVPHVTETWIVGASAGPESQSGASRDAIAISDTLIEEFLAADRYVVGVPMYNFNIPSTLKAYIDQIVRAGKTFAVGPTGSEGLVKDKKALFITTSGGAYPPGTELGELDFQEPYLRAIFKFIGVTDVRFVKAEGMNQGVDMAAKSRAKAERTLADLAITW
jgi:FMN-dependent NADH-azoreductase